MLLLIHHRNKPYLRTRATEHNSVQVRLGQRTPLYRWLELNVPQLYVIFAHRHHFEEHLSDFKQWGN